MKLLDNSKFSVVHSLLLSAACCGAIPAPKAAFKDLLEVARQAQAMEQANTQGINAAYQTAQKEQDYPAIVLLEWFIKEQVEEEDWADEMVERTERASRAGGLTYLDRHIERNLADEVVDLEKTE